MYKQAWALLSPRPSYAEFPKEFSLAMFRKGAPPAIIVTLEGRGFTGQRGVLMTQDDFVKFLVMFEDDSPFHDVWMRIQGILFDMVEDPLGITFSSIQSKIEEQAGIQITGNIEQAPASCATI